MATYTPPPGDAVVITLVANGYVPQTGDNVVIQLQASGVGEQTLSPSGISSLTFGTADVQNFTRYISGASCGEQLSTGVAALSTPPIDLDVYTNGSDFFAAGMGPGGSGFIAHRVRTIASAGGIKMDAYGQPMMAGGIRWVDLNPSHGIQSATYGTAFVARALREVVTTGVFGSLYGLSQVGGDRAIVLSGFSAAMIGLAHVLDNTQRPSPLGIEGEIGSPSLMLEYRTVRPSGLFVPEEARFGINTKLQLSTRYLSPRNENDFWNRGGVGTDGHLYNRNRRIDMVLNGISPPFRQVPLTHVVKNNARLLEPSGVDFRRDGQALVADAIRQVEPAGYVRAVGVGEYVVVRNSARMLSPSGMSHAAHGIASLQKTRRYFPYITAGKHDAYGLPFVAPRVRGVTADRPVTQLESMVPAPTVWFSSRAVAPAPVGGAFPGAAFGIAALSIRVNAIKPRAFVNAQRWGEAAVRNRTPELRPAYDGGPAFGAAAVRTSFRNLPAQGVVALLVGLSDVAYRTKRITAPSLLSFGNNLLHRVTKATPDPPGFQYITPPGFFTQAITMTGHSITANSIYTTGLDFSRFGSASVVVLGIFPESILPPWEHENSQIGKPSIVRNRTLWVEGDFFSLTGKPDVGPRTIWAPTGAPQQAKDNHPPGDEHPVDFFETSPPGRGMPAWGSHSVSNQHRSLVAFSIASRLLIGVPAISTNPQRVMPEGVATFKTGFPMTNRAGDTSPFGFDFFEEGACVVAHAPEMVRYVVHTGNDFARFGAADPQNFHRELPVAGISALAIGTAWVQRPPPPADPDGLLATSYGTSMVAYRIRTYALSGFDSARITWAPGSFALRITVVSKGRTMPSGFLASVIGAASISARNHGVLTNGIGPVQNAIPAATRVKGLDRISVAGYGLEAGPSFGELWAMAVVHGQIMPRGDEHAAYGAHNIGAQSIHANGIEPVADHVPAPRIGAALAPSAVQDEGFGVPVFIGDGCGPQYRAMDGLEDGSMGLAEVAHG